MPMKKSKQGYSLIELIVALFLSVGLLTGVITLFSAISQKGNEQLARDFLRTKLHQLAFMMSNEIARAGFCYDCQYVNPYILQGESALDESLFTKKNVMASAILINDSHDLASGHCIRFAYNHDKRLASLEITPDDAKGFRLDYDNDRDHGVIEIYENYNGLANWDCDAGNWYDMTTDELNILTLTFTRTFYQTNNNSQFQQLTIAMSAALTNNKAIKESIRFTVSLLNPDK